MSDKQQEGSDRRERNRARATLSAFCLVQAEVFKARIFEINHQGMTLICDPSLPEKDQFDVICRLKNAREFHFKVKVHNWQKLNRAQHHILRLGLVILNPTAYMDDFLCELALERLRDLKTESSRLKAIHEDSIGSKNDRGFQRLAFHLPALAWVKDKSYKCNTLNVSTGGMRLWVPEDFPGVNVFILSYETPDGRPVRLTAGVRNRQPDDEGGWQLGLRVMSGNRQFIKFLRKYEIWKSPES